MFTLPAWLAIALVGVFIFILLNCTPPDGWRWFFRLRRPRWLTCEGAIPLILMPYLLWSPIGTYVTWAMIPLNPDAA